MCLYLDGYPEPKSDGNVYMSICLKHLRSLCTLSQCPFHFVKFFFSNFNVYDRIHVLASMLDLNLLGMSAVGKIKRHPSVGKKPKDKEWTNHLNCKWSEFYGIKQQNEIYKKKLNKRFGCGPDVPHCTMIMKRCEYLIEFCGNLAHNEMTNKINENLFLSNPASSSLCLCW